MNHSQTLAAIKALPHMTARRTDGEYRVTMSDAAMRELMPTATHAQRRERQEELAAYTDCAADALGTAQAMAGHAIANAPALPISWRDENYGAVCCAHAFRLYDLEPEGLAFTAYRMAIMRAGFTFHYNRAAWIACDQGADVRLCEELAKAGFTISAGDVRTKAEA